MLKRGYNNLSRNISKFYNKLCKKVRNKEIEGKKFLIF